MKNENIKMTLDEINTELKTISEALGAAKAELKALESTGDTSTKAIADHAKINSKIQILNTREAMLISRKPAAQYSDMMAEVEKARMETSKAAEALTQAEADVRKILAPLLHFTLNDAIRDSRPVAAALSVFQKANGKYMRLLRPAIEFGVAHGINTKSQKFVTPSI